MAIWATVQNSIAGLPGSPWFTPTKPIQTSRSSNERCAVNRRPNRKQKPPAPASEVVQTTWRYVSRRCSSQAAERNQLPSALRRRRLLAHDVEIAVVGLKLVQHCVRLVPAIDYSFHQILPPVQPKPYRALITRAPGVAFHFQLHRSLKSDLLRPIDQRRPDPTARRIVYGELGLRQICPARHDNRPLMPAHTWRERRTNP